MPSKESVFQRMSPVSIKNISIEHQLSILLLGVLFLTNRYLSLPADSRWLDFAAGDSYSYIAIANAFPSLPAADAILPFHHSQRFFFPYLLGGVAWLLHVPAQDAFFAFAVLAVLGLVLVFHGIVDCLTPEPAKKMMLLSLLILNTYVFRYYLAIPWMISDLTFQLSLAVLLLGLLRESPGLTFAGLLAVALSKQTALLLIPGVMGWIWCEWKSSPRKVRVLRCVCVALLGTVVYQGTGWLARPFSGPNVNADHVLGLFRWMTSAFSLERFLVFSLRGIIGFAFPLALLLSLAVTRKLPTGWYRNRKVQLSLLLAGSLCLQPFLGGPVITGQNITRLDMLGYLPLLVGVASILAATPLSASLQRGLVFLTTFAVSMSSFHHFYSFLGVLKVERAGRFAAVYLASALLLFLGSLVLQHSEKSQ
jgi:hypothetical protein